MEVNPFTPQSAYYWMAHSVHLGTVQVRYAGWVGTVGQLGQANYQGRFKITPDYFIQEFAEMWECGALKAEDLPALFEAIDQGMEE
jgi:hypothetical protein